MTADHWWICFLVNEHLLDKADNLTAPAILNFIPLNGKQGTLQNVADIYGGRPISARGRKSRNKEEEVCLPHVCHFHHTNSTILTLTVPRFPAWFICVTKWRLYKFLGKIFLFLKSRCVIFLIIIKLLLSTAVCLGKVFEHAHISIGCNCVVTDATIPGPWLYQV